MESPQPCKMRFEGIRGRLAMRRGTSRNCQLPIDRRCWSFSIRC